MGSESTTLKIDAEPTNLLTSSKKTETTRNQQVPSGVPGADPNAIGNRAASIQRDIEVLNTTEDQRDTSGVAGQQYEISKLADLQVKTIRVSVMLPTSYYRTLHTRDAMKLDSSLVADDVVMTRPHWSL